MSLIPKSDCMSATDLNHAVRHLCHVVNVCFKLMNDFMTFDSFTSLINKSWELFLVVCD